MRFTRVVVVGGLLALVGPAQAQGLDDGTGYFRAAASDAVTGDGTGYFRGVRPGAGPSTRAPTVTTAPFVDPGLFPSVVGAPWGFASPLWSWIARQMAWGGWPLRYSPRGSFAPAGRVGRMLDSPWHQRFPR